MPQYISRNDLSKLIEFKNDSCISIYLPTHPYGREEQQDPIRLRNLASRAEKQLVASGMRRPEAEKLLEPIQKTLTDSDFWQHQHDGLALFLAPGFFQRYRLPFSFSELLVITSAFHIKPLLPLLSEDGQFYLLAISQNQIRLLQGSRDTVTEFDLKDIPTSLAEALRFDDPEKQLQYHTSTRSAVGDQKRGAMYHGQGTGVNGKDKDLLRFFHQVDGGLKEVLEDTHIPLLLAGVEYLLPIYREANSYPLLLDEFIPGNPDKLSDEQLHEQAWQIIKPIFKEKLDKAAAQYRMLAGQEAGTAVQLVAQVARAAYYGWIDTLFVETNAQVWGRFDPENGAIIAHEKPTPGDRDLLDFAAEHTLINKGTVYAVAKDDVPGSSQAAAILRYPYVTKNAAL
jgi:hypothetical protein